MKVTFLGTGAGLPSKFRNTQSFVFDFMQELKECWMFDCGEASQHKILHTSIRPTKITKIFISHLHADHVLGLIGFLSSRSFLMSKSKNPITIYGPSGIKDFVEYNLKATYVTLGYELHFVEFSDEQCIIENKKVSVYTYPLKHSLQSYAFKIIFKDEKGSLKVDELKNLGISPGPFYREIKENSTFDFNGKTYQSKDYLTEDKPGKKIAIIPDTIYFSNLKNFILGSDVIISECTYLSEMDADLAKRNTHLSIKDIKNLLFEKQVEKVFLTHISARYTRDNEVHAVSSLKTDESIFCDNIYVVKDLDEYNL